MGDAPIYIAAAVSFVSGLLSFFSPCVVPLLPVYMAYLAGGAANLGNDSTSRGKLVVNTLLFVLGIGTTFVLLGLAATSLGQQLNSLSGSISRIGGLFIFVLGLIQLGVIGGSETFKEEHRLPVRFENLSMNPLVAYLFGLVFSFAWTPCVGPVLASVILAAGAASTQATGMVLIVFYTLGLAIPFILIALVADKAMKFIKDHKSWMKNTTTIAGIVLVFVGVGMITGLVGGSPSVSNNNTEPSVNQEVPSTQTNANLAPDFSLKDVEGNTYTLSELKGKVVVVNFWAPWCRYCIQEMPDFEKVYQGLENDDVVILAVAQNEGSVDDVYNAFKDTGATYPCLIDNTGQVFRDYQVQSLPTTYVIDRQGSVVRSVLGATDSQSLKALIEVAKHA